MGPRFRGDDERGEHAPSSRSYRFTFQTAKIVIASEAKQSSFLSCCAMDCFAALAMTGKHTFTIPRRDSPGFCRSSPALLEKRGRRESRVRAAPAVSRARRVKSAHEHTGSAEAVRPSLRNGFNGFLRALPGDRLSCHRRFARQSALRNLKPAPGRQDHTTSPSAIARRSSKALPASTASRPTFVTIASAPHEERDGGSRKVICSNGKAENFLRKGWTGF
jgi:hypothetical protein